MVTYFLNVEVKYCLFWTIYVLLAINIYVLEFQNETFLLAKISVPYFQQFF